MSTNIEHLPAGFLLSQHSLSTYQRCKRRFWLKYVQHQPWPVTETEQPLEYQRHLERGVVFHRWIERSLMGLAADTQASLGDDPELTTWWAAWKSFDLAQLPDELRLPELPLTIRLGIFRLYARYDLVALKRGERAVIMDWKTLQSVPPLGVLRHRMQTRIYCYMLARAGSVITGGAALAPEQVEMCYWFTVQPEAMVTIPYTRAAYEQDQQLLNSLAEEIASLPAEAFTLTDKRENCAACQYRTLCERSASQPGQKPADWLDEDADFALDLDSVPAVDW